MYVNIYIYIYHIFTLCCINIVVHISYNMQHYYMKISLRGKMKEPLQLAFPDEYTQDHHWPPLIAKEPESAAPQPKAEKRPSEIGSRTEPPPLRTRSWSSPETRSGAISLGFPLKCQTRCQKDVIRMSRDIQFAFETIRLINLKLNAINNEDLFQLALTK